MTTYEIKRWDSVIFGNHNNQSPMIYINPDMYLLEFFKTNQYSIFCEIIGSGSVYDGLLLPAVVNTSAYTPNCRPNYYADTNTYVVTLDIDWKGYPLRNGSVIFSGYKNPKPEVKPISMPVAGPMPSKVTANYMGGPLKSSDMIGIPKTFRCDNGQTFQAAIGTYGAVNNSPRFCPQIEVDKNMPVKTSTVSNNNSTTGGSTTGGSTTGGSTPSNGKMLGAKETHRCANGTTFTCQGGTLGCVDNSPKYCGGSKETREVDCGDWKANCPVNSAKEECCGQK